MNDHSTSESIEAVADIFGIQIEESVSNLFMRALTRKQYLEDNKFDSQKSQEALATLGDAVIDLIVIQYLMEDEGINVKGDITTRKQKLVNANHQGAVARKAEIQEYVLWGKGEEDRMDWKKGKAMSDCLEALIGAIYQTNHNLNVCRSCLDKIGYFNLGDLYPI